MISGLKLKHDASGGKTMHDGDPVIVGYMKSPRLLGCSRRFCKAWSFRALKNFQLLGQPYIRVVKVIF